MISSCKKEILNQELRHTYTSESRSSFNVAENEIISKIQDFKKLLKNRTQMEKNNETKSIDEAIWTIETYLNYTYSPQINTENVIEYENFTKEIEIDLPQSIDNEKLLEMYDSAKLYCKEVYDNIATTEKKPCMFDVEYNIDDNTLVGIKVNFAVAKGSISSVTNNFPITPIFPTYGTNESFKNGYNGNHGTCDGTNPNVILVNNFKTKANVLLVTGFHVNIVQIKSFPSNAIDIYNTNQPYFGYCGPYYKAQLLPTCFYAPELNYYLQRLRYFAMPLYLQQYNTNNNTNKEIDNVDVFSSTIGCCGSEDFLWYFRLYAADVVNIPPNPINEEF